MLQLEALGRLALGQVPSSTAAAVTFEAGAFTVTGQTVNTTTTLPVEPLVIAATGQNVATVVGVPFEVGAYTVTGQNVDPRENYVLRFEPFAAYRDVHFLFSALGEAALGQAKQQSPTGVSFELAGQDVKFSHSLSVSPASISVTAGSANLFLGNILSPTVWAVTTAFQPFGTVIRLPVSPAQFAVTFSSSPPFELARRSPKLRRFPRVGSTTVSARSRGAGVKVRAYGG